MTDYSHQLPPPPPLPTESFRQLLIQKEMNTWEFAHIINDDPETLRILKEQLPLGTCRIVSDGSFFAATRTGTSALILSCPGLDHPLTIQNRVPGRPEDQSAYRSELAGIYTAFRLEKALFAFLGLPDNCRIAFGCDGEGALKSCFQSCGCTVKESDFDLISAVHTLLTETSSSWTWRHVRGHQDVDTTTTLDWWAQLSVLADFYAQRFN